MVSIILIICESFSLLLNICLHAVKRYHLFLCITNNSIKHKPFVYTQLDNQAVLFQTIQFSISFSFALSLNAKQFYLTHRSDPIRCNHSGTEWTWEQWQCSGTSHFPNIQNWSLTIRLFNAISRTHVGRILPFC